MGAWPKSNDSPLLFGLGRVFLLEAQPQEQPNEAQCYHRHVERRTDWDEDGFKRPLNEFRDRGDDFLRVHGS